MWKNKPEPGEPAQPHKLTNQQEQRNEQTYIEEQREQGNWTQVEQRAGANN